MVYKNFNAGLVRNIYPGPEMKELQGFPKNLWNTFYHFYNRVLKGKKQMYITCYSSIPDWNNEGQMQLPYHFIKIGGATRTNPNIEQPIPKRPRTVQEINNSLHEERCANLWTIYSELRNIHQGSQVRVNYFSKKTIVTSLNSTVITEQDADKIQNFEVPFLCGELDISPKSKALLCSIFQGTDGGDHKCEYCEDNNSARPTTPH